MSKTKYEVRIKMVGDFRPWEEKEARSIDFKGKIALRVAIRTLNKLVPNIVEIRINEVGSYQGTYWQGNSYRKQITNTVITKVS